MKCFQNMFCESISKTFSYLQFIDNLGSKKKKRKDGMIKSMNPSSLCLYMKLKKLNAYDQSMLCINSCSKSTTRRLDVSHLALEIQPGENMKESNT